MTEISFTSHRRINAVLEPLPLPIGGLMRWRPTGQALCWVPSKNEYGVPFEPYKFRELHDYFLFVIAMNKLSMAVFEYGTVPYVPPPPTLILPSEIHCVYVCLGSLDAANSMVYSLGPRIKREFSEKSFYFDVSKVPITLTNSASSAIAYDRVGWRKDL